MGSREQARLLTCISPGRRTWGKEEEEKRGGATVPMNLKPLGYHNSQHMAPFFDVAYKRTGKEKKKKKTARANSSTIGAGSRHPTNKGGKAGSKECLLRSSKQKDNQEELGRNEKEKKTDSKGHWGGWELIRDRTISYKETA